MEMKPSDFKAHDLIAGAPRQRDAVQDCASRAAL
jgi:hypothetical protein